MVVVDAAPVRVHSIGFVADGEVFRASSRDTVEGARPIALAITRTPSFRSRRQAISSRSSNVSLDPGTSHLRNSW